MVVYTNWYFEVGDQMKCRELSPGRWSSRVHPAQSRTSVGDLGPHDRVYPKFSRGFDTRGHRIPVDNARNLDPCWICLPHFLWECGTGNKCGKIRPSARSSPVSPHASPVAPSTEEYPPSYSPQADPTESRTLVYAPSHQPPIPSSA